jgi:NADH:ubiquinone oxidoreductase subunit 6 (subunit J)
VLAIVALSSDIGHIGSESLTPGLRQLSRLIFDRYVFPFELVSLVLVAAMIGAIVLATREKERP